MRLVSRHLFIVARAAARLTHWFLNPHSFFFDLSLPISHILSLFLFLFSYLRLFVYLSLYFYDSFSLFFYSSLVTLTFGRIDWRLVSSPAYRSFRAVFLPPSRACPFKKLTKKRRLFRNELRVSSPSEKMLAYVLILIRVISSSSRDLDRYQSFVSPQMDVSCVYIHRY